ncbi:NS1 protein [Bluetongue virus]|uniref:Non-structural protein NS1 n=1 Tax=Bluetongue virus TaxID=40051 RepID=A0A1J0F5H1_BTV|nr:NS1 protein [Bluetongue virus]
MERFLRKYNISGDNANATRTFLAISPQWTCSHLRRNCLFNGMCAKQHFERAMIAVTDADEPRKAIKLVELAKEAMHDRESVWLQCFRSFSQPYEEDVEGKLKRAGADLLESYRKSGMMDEAIKQTALINSERIRLDDSYSALPYIYVPIREGQIINPTFISRYRQVAYYFYNPDAAEDWIDPNLFEIRGQHNQIKREVERQIATCPYTGYRGRVLQIMFLPIHIINFLKQDAFARHFNRYVSMAIQQYLRVGQIEETRYVQQMFGEIPAGEFPLHQMMLMRRDFQNRERNIVEARVKRSGDDNWQSWLLPMIIVREGLACAEHWEWLLDYMNGKHICQLCYLKCSRQKQECKVIDVRMAELTGCTPFRIVKIENHVGMNSIFETKLIRDEQIGRIGDHYYTTHCYTGAEALITTAIQIQRWARGCGIWNDQGWREGVFMLGRVLLRWELSKAQRSAILRLFCFVCYGYAPRADGTIPDWNNLGDFLDMILKGPELSEDEDEKAYATMLEMVRCVMTLCYGEKTQFAGFAAPACQGGEVINLAARMSQMWIER